MTTAPMMSLGPDPERAAKLALLAEQVAAVEKRPVVGGGAATGPGAAAPQQAYSSGSGSSGGSGRGSGGRASSGGGGRWGPPRGGRSDGPPENPEVEAKAICLRLLAVAPRPRAGLAQALARREIPEEIADRVLDRLTEVGLIDDAAYAAAFVRTKHRDRGLGRSALASELRRLGVDEAHASVAVTQVDEDAERLRAETLVAKRLDAAMAAGPVAARRRLLALLSRRGYPAGLATQVVLAAVGEYPVDGYAAGESADDEMS